MQLSEGFIQKAEVPSPLLCNPEVTVSSAVSRQKEERCLWRNLRSPRGDNEIENSAVKQPRGDTKRGNLGSLTLHMCEASAEQLTGGSVPGLWTEILLAAKGGRDKNCL